MYFKKYTYPLEWWAQSIFCSNDMSNWKARAPQMFKMPLVIHSIE
jgi:hypothetical protein